MQAQPAKTPHQTAIDFLKKQTEDLRKRLESCETIYAMVIEDENMIREVHRWEKECVATTRVNSLVDKYESRSNCGCCSDTPIEVFPYVEENGIRIYSKPSMFIVGNENYGNGIVPKEDWLIKMREANISGTVITQVQAYLDANKPIPWDEFYKDDEERE